MKMFLKIQFLPRRAQDFEPSESEKRGKTGRPNFHFRVGVDTPLLSDYYSIPL